MFLQVGPLDSFFIEGPAPKEHAISDLGNGGSSGRGAGEEEEGEPDDVCVDDLLAGIEVCGGVHMCIEVCGVKSVCLGARPCTCALSPSQCLYLSQGFSLSLHLSFHLSLCFSQARPCLEAHSHTTQTLSLARSILSLRTPLR